MIEGKCHCGKIKLGLANRPAAAIECNCSHCSRKGYVLAFVPRDQLSVQADPADVATYTFNRHAIKHHFCATCGCAPYGEAEGKDGPTAAVNLRCFEIDLADLEIKRVDGKSF